MASIKLWRFSSTESPSSGLNFGNHLSGCLSRGWRGADIWTAPGLVHGLFVGGFCCLPAIMGTWVVGVVIVEGADYVEEKAALELVLVESTLVDCRGREWKGGLSGGEKNGDEAWNEGVWGGVDDKISLVDDWASNFFVFLWWEGRGNSNGVTPSFSLWEWVKMWVDWKDEQMLLSDNSYYCGFSSEIEIPFNFWIKVWTWSIS